MPLIRTLAREIIIDSTICFIVQFYGIRDSAQKRCFFDASRCMKNETGEYEFLQLIAILQEQDIRDIRLLRRIKTASAL